MALKFDIKSIEMRSLSFSISLLLFLVLDWNLLPLDVSSVITSARNQVSVLGVAVVESNSWDVLGVTGQSHTVLSVLQNWSLIDTD